MRLCMHIDGCMILFWKFCHILLPPKLHPLQLWYLTGREEVFQEMKKLGIDQKFSVPTFRYVYTQNNAKIERYLILMV